VRARRREPRRVLANGVLQRSFCAIWQIVTTHVGFVRFRKISQTHVTFAAIYYNNSRAIVTKA